MNAALFHLLLLFVVTPVPDRFGGPAVWPVQIHIAAEDIKSLRTEPRKAVPAHIHFCGREATNATVKLKGRGSFQPIDQKPSFTIQFERSEQQPFGDLYKIHLNNSVEDGSYLKEKLGSAIFRSAGIPVPKVGHARVSLNGLELGLYVLKEGFTADFIARSFGNAAGGLYEAGLANDIDQPMELDSGEPDPDALRALASATREPAGERIQHLARVLEFEAFVRFMAIESLLCHWDGYSFSANNFRIYVTEHGKIHFLPSGMDQIFAKADLPWDMPMGGLVARAVMGTEPGRTEYAKTLRGLVQEFDPRRWIDEIEHWRAQLRPHLTAAEYQSIEEKSSALAQQLHSRKRHLLVQLENAERRSLRFVNDIAAISGWRAFNSPEDGMLTQDESGLRIVAGAKTSASWRATVRLKPGHYIMRADATTQGLIPLPFGRRNGATLRVVGTDARSHSELASGTTPLDCTFEVIEEQDVTLACELRASAGMVLFAKPILLQVAQKK